MHTRVQEGAKATLASSNKPEILQLNEMTQDNKWPYLLPWAPPAQEGKSAMMDHMKWGQVCELFTGNKKHGVSQVNKLKKMKSIMVELDIISE